MSRPLFLLTNGEPAGDAKVLVDFLLSERGQELVRKHGYLRTGSELEASDHGAAIEARHGMTLPRSTPRCSLTTRAERPFSPRWPLSALARHGRAVRLAEPAGLAARGLALSDRHEVVLPRQQFGAAADDLRDAGRCLGRAAAGGAARASGRRCSPRSFCRRGCGSRSR